MESKMHFQPHDDIRAQARHWVLKFNGDQPPGNEDIAALRAWAARGPAHRAELERAQAFWCDADMLTELAVPHVREIAAHQGVVPRWSWFRAAHRPRVGAIAAASVLCVATVLALMAYAPAWDRVGNGLYVTGIGEQKTLKLTDRSSIRLDTDSQVRVAYDKNSRVLHLLKGKAYFDVAKNPERPFEVYAGDGMVRAVGTAFSVYLVDKNVQVTVAEGKVDLLRLEPEKRAEIPGPANTEKAAVPDKHPAVKTFRTLEVGQRAIFDRDKEEVRQLEAIEMSRDLAWREGVLIFTDEPLRQVIAEVNRYTATQIEVADPALGNLKVGGRFKVGKLDALFDVLESGFGVQVSYVHQNHVKLQPATE